MKRENNHISKKHSTKNMMSMTKRKILDLKTAKELKENALIGETFEELNQ